MKKYAMNVPKCTFKNMNLKFGRGEGGETGRIKDREDSIPFFPDVTVSISYSSPESGEC